jgi:hypothetical protein
LVEGTSKPARPLLNAQRAVAYQSFRSKLEELETAIENQKQSILTFIRAEPIIGIKPGTTSNGVVGTASHAGLDMDADADGDADVDDDDATIAGDGSGHSRSGGDDSMMLGGELMDSGEEAHGDEIGSDAYQLEESDIDEV